MARARLLVIAFCCAAALGLALRWSALSAGFSGDDYVQLCMLEQAYSLTRGPLDLFWFSGRNPAEAAKLLDVGYIPWWGQEGLRLSMLRPLSSALIALDFKLLQDNAVAYHVHSMLWWLALLSVAALLYRKLLPGAAGAVALILFAVDEAHSVPVAWLANRSTLVATCLGALGLWAHLRWRREGRVRGWAMEAVAFTLALFR